MKIINRTFEIELLKDIVSSDENCREGYKKCGIVNKNRDYLCLKLDEYAKCPVNKILIDESSYFFDNDFTTEEMGDKYVHFSNKKIDDYMLINLNITENEIETKIDKDTLYNLMDYNPEIGHFQNNSYLYLNGEYLEFIKKEKIPKAIEEYEKRGKNYGSEKIKEMNRKIDKYREYMKYFGIAIFVVTILFPINIGIYFLFKKEKECSFGGVSEMPSADNCLSLCLIGIFTAILNLLWCFFRYSCAICFSCEMNQTRLSYILLFVFSPVLIGSILIFVLSYLNKQIFNDYSSLKLIYEHKNSDVLDNILNKMDIFMIFSIIIVIVFIAYLILICIANKIKGLDNSISSTKIPLDLNDDDE